MDFLLRVDFDQRSFCNSLRSSVAHFIHQPLSRSASGSGTSATVSVSVGISLSPSTKPDERSLRD